LLVAILLVLGCTIAAPFFALEPLGFAALLILGVFTLLAYPMIVSFSRVLDKLFAVWKRGIVIRFHK
jgi:hypothetical protein